ncbi:tRNA (guanosine(37)-N1)-methyltransferase TrmD [Candidatus Giovannonibacteria bacterium]|nr:tRNA (guanosine(37)-N1)-methyltransferase TrmD [Candidatus Giovannonibacteria bacterium]
MNRFDIITIFPHIFDSYLKESLVRRAQAKKIIDVKIHNLRDFTDDKHKKVDDRVFGGGPGMVLQVGPIYRAVQHLKAKSSKLKARTILFSTRGKKLDSKTAKRLSKYDRLILICGRYEGVDERVAKYVADEEISIGDYVLSGGELPALVLIESVSRFLPGFLGKSESLEEIKGSYPVYTRPEVFTPSPFSSLSHFSSSLIRANRRIGKHGKFASSTALFLTRRQLTVPKVLLSGDHKKIEEWRKKFSK